MQEKQKNKVKSWPWKSTGPTKKRSKGEQRKEDEDWQEYVPSEGQSGKAKGTPWYEFCG